MGAVRLLTDADPYRLAVKYLFLTNEGDAEERALALEPFNATHEQNDYEVRVALYLPSPAHAVLTSHFFTYGRFPGRCATSSRTRASHTSSGVRSAH